MIKILNRSSNFIHFSELETWVKLIVIVISATFFLSILLFARKVSGIKNGGFFAKKYAYEIDKDLKGIRPSAAASIFYLQNKEKKVLIPDFIYYGKRSFHILEAIFWIQYNNLKKTEVWKFRFLVLFKTMASICTFTVISIYLFWQLGIDEFQNYDYIWITYVMVLWGLFFSTCSLLIIFNQSVNVLKSLKISYEAKKEIKRLLYIGSLLPFAAVWYELLYLPMILKSFFKKLNLK